MKRCYAFTCVALLLFGLAGHRAAGADADPFAHADWDAILKHDPGLTVQHDTDSVAARYTCVEGSNVVDGCYTGGAESGNVNGTWLAVIPIDGMGTGGIMTIRLYVWRNNGAHYLSTLSVYKCVAHIAAGRLVVKQPAYKAGEGNCCATHHSVTTYTVSGGKLVQTSSVTLPGNL